MKVFYSEKMVAPRDGFSPSAAKPAMVMANWRANQLPLEEEEPEPISRDAFALAHDREFVDAVLDLQRDNGFGSRSEMTAAALPYTTGAMLAAARYAIRNGTLVAAPCSGFHHAGYRYASGFCTFNGLMVTAFALRNEELVDRVGILDCDVHFGDGTEDILDKLNARDWIQHITSGHGYPMNAAPFFEALPGLVRGFSGCDVLLYQAGADAHINDPLGGFLTTDQLRERDRIVFKTAVEMGLPVAWNLAGGYQRPIERVLEIHLNTARCCVDALTS